MRVLLYMICMLTLLSCVGNTIVAQSSTGTVFGTVFDQNAAIVSGATVIAENTATGFARSATTDSSGGYRLLNIPTGQYKVTIAATGFGKYVQIGITLYSGQEVAVDAVLNVAGSISEVVPVDENASVLNTETTEVSTRFDSRRISELPIAPNRSVYNILHSVPGVIQRTTGQTAFALGISFSANGGRIRSNNFQLDGQDMNDPALGGSQMPLNNPDAIQEVRVITSQFMPEHGHNAGSVVEIIGKSGTNDFHGSAFWFHNNENFNACSNIDKKAGFCHPNATVESKRGAPHRLENQIGFTVGGPVIFPRFGKGGFYKGKDRTFFFADYQRWSDERTPSFTIGGAPTVNGRNVLRMRAGNDHPQVDALLHFVPAGIANGESRKVILPDMQSFDVELGDLTSSSDFLYDNHQGSIRIDHSVNENNLIYARYRYDFESTRGAGQIAPPGHGTLVGLNVHAAVVVWTSSLSSSISNEARVAWKRYDLTRDALDPLAYSIPAIEILDLGIVGGPEAETRTAFGSPTNLPVYRTSDTYQLTEALSISKGDHAFKFGLELRRSGETSTLFSLARGNLLYVDLNSFFNDIAQSASRGLPLAGSDTTQHYRWHEGYFYAQDKWRMRPDLTLLYGIRYEYPGDTFQYLREVNQRILDANNDDPEFRFTPYPKKDTNNWMPRVGLNWNPKTGSRGIAGFITGGDKLVVRLGYARSYDAWAVNINQNIFTSFPFTRPQNFSGENAFRDLTGPAPITFSPRLATRIVVPNDFRSPAMDQISFDVQRELGADLLLRIGYIRTRGTGLFQSVQGNPRIPCPFGTGLGTCNTTGIDRNTGLEILRTQMPPPALRVDPSRGAITIRANSASSTYDALQVSLEKRLSRGFSFGLHYTWSTLIDTASDFFSPSIAEGGVSQDPFDWAADKGRGSYDRPHRLSGNLVYDLPFFSKQKGTLGKVLGGWQVNSFFSFQSGAPFSPLNGSDPTGSGGAIRTSLFTNLDLSRMSVAELYQTESRLRANAEAQGRLIFSTTPSSLCGWLPSPALPVTLFSAPRGRVICDAQGTRTLTFDYIGVLEGQRIGNAGRNILRSDSFKNVDIGIIKNTQLNEKVRAQIWVDFFNAFNWRNFGIPSGGITDPGFLDQWATDGGSRRIRLGARLVF